MVNPGGARLAQGGDLLRLRAYGSHRGRVRLRTDKSRIGLPGFEADGERRALQLRVGLRPREEEGGGGPPRRMYAITDSGEAYLEAWARACEEYHKLMSQFSQVYKRRPTRSSEQQ